MTPHSLGDTLIRFRSVTIGYPHHPVLRDVTFELPSQGYIGIVGPNGAGKTTLLRTILGTLKPLDGRIEFVRPVRFGYVPQAHTMDEHFPLTALDVTLMGRYHALGPIRRPSQSDRDRAMAALDAVGIGSLARKPYRDLSGGQRQRTLMARALAAEPEALVLDEPTRDMDIASQKAVMDLLDTLHDERAMLVLLVSHDLNVVANHVHSVAIVGNEEFVTGPVEEIVSSGRLSDIYGLPVEVARVNGSRVVL